MPWWVWLLLAVAGQFALATAIGKWLKHLDRDQ